MTKNELLLIQLGEEASEIAKVAAKCLRFGVTSSHPSMSIDNDEQLCNELNDLLAVVQALKDRGVLKLTKFGDTIEIENKLSKMDFYEVLSRRCGTLTDG